LGGGRAMKRTSLPLQRREFISLLGGAAAAWPLAARAQQSTGQPLVGLLSPLSAAAWVPILGAFRRGMRDLGYVEGANVALPVLSAEGRRANRPALAKEWVAPKPAVIAVGSPAAILETHKATRAIPIVMATSQDPTVHGHHNPRRRRCADGRRHGAWWRRPLARWRRVAVGA